LDERSLPVGENVTAPRQIGRYSISHQIAAGGMATVHLARLAGPVGFSRVVAVKHLHPHLSGDPQFKAMLIDEARLAARVRHPNVVPILDVVVHDAELFLVMEYVQGEALGYLRRAARQQAAAIPFPIASAIMVGALQGLHAAHEARDEGGRLLNLVHRDFSPPNILVGVDGIAMVLDFGVAKAMQNIQESRPGTVKGKSSYMAPEQIRGESIDRRVDIFAAGVVLWELLTGHRLFGGATEQERMYRVLNAGDVPAPSTVAAGVPAALDTLTLKALKPNPADRHQTALEMAEALEAAVTPASQRAVGEWVGRTAASSLARRAELLKRVEVSGVPQAVPDFDGSSGVGAVPRETGSGRSRDNHSYPAAEIAAPPKAHISDVLRGRWWRYRHTALACAGAIVLVGAIVSFGRGSSSASRQAHAATRAPAPVSRPSPVADVAAENRPREPVPIPGNPAGEATPPSPAKQAAGAAVGDSGGLQGPPHVDTRAARERPVRRRSPTTARAEGRPAARAVATPGGAARPQPAERPGAIEGTRSSDPPAATPRKHVPLLEESQRLQLVD
jgi:serine/threonine-protein kinase